jgi:hypothetical protein
MKPIALALLPALYLGIIPAGTADSSAFIYYGANQPFAHPAPPTLDSLPPQTYIPSAPRTFIPISSEHRFRDSRLPTVADTSVRLFIRVYDAEHGVYRNEEVHDPDCLLACLNPQRPAF